LSTPAAVTARQATSTIPIVFSFVSDPVASRLAISLSRPGGNATGVTTLQPDVAGKLLQLFREAIPNLARVGVLWNPNNPGKVLAFKEISAVASPMGIEIQSLEARAPAEIEPALKALRTDRTTGVIVLSDAVTGFNNLRYTTEAVSRTRLPNIHEFANYVDFGGLMSYGSDGRAMVRQAAKQVGRPGLARSASGRPPNRAAHEVVARHKYEDGQSTRRHDRACRPVAGGSGDRVGALARHPPSASRAPRRGGARVGPSGSGRASKYRARRGWLTSRNTAS
jgi:hypothetical protein